MLSSTSSMGNTMPSQVSDPLHLDSENSQVLNQNRSRDFQRPALSRQPSASNTSISDQRGLERNEFGVDFWRDMDSLNSLGFSSADSLEYSITPSSSCSTLDWSFDSNGKHISSISGSQEIDENISSDLRTVSNSLNERRNQTDSLHPITENQQQYRQQSQGQTFEGELSMNSRNLFAHGNLPEAEIGSFSLAATINLAQNSHPDQEQPGEQICEGELSLGEPRLFPSEYAAALEPEDFFSRYFKGGFAGVFTSYIEYTTGISTFIHELPGHIYLGGGLTYNFPNGIQPKYYVDGFAAAHKIEESSSFLQGLGRFFRWVVLGGSMNGKGPSGYAYPLNGSDGPNKLGMQLGLDGRTAWISLAGSVPGLMINGMAVVVGSRIVDRKPALGGGLVLFGMCSHVMASYYPFSAAAMSKETLLTEAFRGHDFAKFSVKISEMIGCSPRSIAIATALGFFGLVPMLSLGSYLHKRSQHDDVVPDGFALRHWMRSASQDQKIEEKFLQLLDSYPKRDELTHNMQDYIRLATNRSLESEESFKFVAGEFHKSRQEFDQYLVGSLGTNILANHKRQILKEWQYFTSRNRIDFCLQMLSHGGLAVAGLVPVVYILGNSVALGLAGVAAGLVPLAPFFCLFHPIKSGYRTFHDWQCSDSQLSPLVKKLSLAQTASSVVSVGLLGAFIASSAASFGTVPALVCSVFAYISAGYLKSQAMREHILHVNGVSVRRTQMSRKLNCIVSNMGKETYLGWLGKKMGLMTSSSETYPFRKRSSFIRPR